MQSQNSETATEESVSSASSAPVAGFVTLTPGGPTPAAGQVALVPGELIPVLPLELPAGLRGSTREQVARRQLMDSAALHPDQTEIRPLLLGGSHDSWSHALVADRAQIGAWLQAAGPACRAVLPDYLALPTTEGMWSVRATPDRVLARLGPQDGFAAEPDLALILLTQALNSETPPPQAVFCEGADLAQIDALFATHDVARIAAPEDAVALGLRPPQVLGHGELGIDLRRDPFATRARLRRRILPWRLPVLLALLAAGLWAAAQITATAAINDEIRATQARTLEVVRAHFVPAGPVLDIRTQVSRALSAARAQLQDGHTELRPLALFGQTVEIITAPGVEAQQALYGATEGLQLVLTVPDFAAGDALVAQLRGLGLAVDVLRSEAGVGRDGVQLEMALRGGADAAEEQP